MKKDLSYRDELVRKIKEAGQELINKAESMIGKDLTSIETVNIYITLDTAREFGEQIPEIRYDVSMLNDITLERMNREI